MATEFDAVVSNAFSHDTTHYILNFLNGKFNILWWIVNFFPGNDALDKAVKSNEAKEASERYPQAKGRLVSFTRNFWRNIQNEIEKSQRGQRWQFTHEDVISLINDLFTLILWKHCTVK